MTSLFADPEFKNVQHVNSEIFAVEQLCKQYGFEDVRHALYRVRVHELGGLETMIRGRCNRADESGVKEGGNG